MSNSEHPLSTALAEASTLSSVAALIKSGLAFYECDPEPLFKSAGIDLNECSDPNMRFSTACMQKLWALSVEATDDPCFGLTAARQFQPAILQGLGFAWLASDTLRDALGRLARFSRMINQVVDIQVEDTGRSTDLVILGPEKWPNYVHAATDLGMAAFLQMCRSTAGEDLNPVRVAMQRPKPPFPCIEKFDQNFRAPIHFEEIDNRLCFDEKVVDMPLATANPELARINDQIVVDYLARFDRASIAMQVRSWIIQHLPDGAPNQETIANALHVSLRSLQRKLKEEDVTFKGLMEETRRELALQYIRESYRSIGEITYMLGFSEPSNFTRAFKRWTGMSPAEYRESA